MKRPSRWKNLFSRKKGRKKKKVGFLKGAAAAIAADALRDTGHIGKHVTKKLTEDGMGGVGGTPVNSASSGAVAGLGTWKDGSQGEPGVNKKRRKAPLLTYSQFKRKSP